ncbi:class I SAM-dependent methyltransferase [uncultured Pseudoteredinibacter sp.]|uniref:class I SAM-dependent methyltransferase n=1 Tax=uncultured Pseudoteredinibacter sp. TaxID=1641701 RepID=UPI0026195D55|nr:class I SAM-dependent methyltransferase [uncultured Pseudoteredinibacter sp.]
MTEIYDQIGVQYRQGRMSDPAIDGFIQGHADINSRTLNIGAGTGSYESSFEELIALEPSWKMIQQRAPSAHPAIQAYAEALPFGDNSFKQCLTVLSIHHWQNRTLALEEIKRVTERRFIALSWNPDATPYWLLQDYFPELYAIDRSIFPKIDELETHFPNIQIYPLAIPANCQDGFTAAYWARPEAYLDDKIRQNMSSFSKIENVDKGLKKLAEDLSSGQWNRKYASLLEQSHLDVGYFLAVWDKPLI